MYEKINSKNYDFLWSVGGQHYLFTSFWLHKGFLSRDFLATSQNNFSTFYISKKQRKKLSRSGLALFHKRFKSYENKIKKQLRVSERIFKEMESKRLSSLSDKELAKDFENSVKYWQKIWGDYFWTEYFCQDRVSEIIEKNDKSFNLKTLKTNIKKMAKLKYEQRKYLNKTFYSGGVLDKYQEEINKRLNLGKKIIDYHFKELIDLLLGKKVKIPNRFVYVKGKFSNWKDILEAKAEKIIKQLEEIDYSIKEFGGNIGNKGYYKGRVKNIEFSFKTDYVREINKMKKGEVLVSGSTGPEMILACKKAGAIITDEGGITSHAALVSRELGIPSVIGTKIATKVLKDGDLVEVDANMGVVKILKK